jgi:predicted enzyme related to lactoylglutathione lyase
MANPFIHVELSTHDLAKAKQFYTRLFDWKLEELPGMNYTLIGVDDGVGGGMMAASKPEIPSHWLPYVRVGDIQAATEKARSLGATILFGPHEVPNAGWLSVFTDPTGATLGMWQPLRETA